MKFLIVLLFLAGCSKAAEFKVNECYEFFYITDFYTYKIINIKYKVQQVKLWVSGSPHVLINTNLTESEIAMVEPYQVTCPE